MLHVASSSEASLIVHIAKNLPVLDYHGTPGATGERPRLLILLIFEAMGRRIPKSERAAVQKELGRVQSIRGFVRDKRLRIELDVSKEQSCRPKESLILLSVKSKMQSN